MLAQNGNIWSSFWLKLVENCCNILCGGYSSKYISLHGICSVFNERRFFTRTTDISHNGKSFKTYLLQKKFWWIFFYRILYDGDLSVLCSDEDYSSTSTLPSTSQSILLKLFILVKEKRKICFHHHQNKPKNVIKIEEKWGERFKCTEQNTCY